MKMTHIGPKLVGLILVVHEIGWKEFTACAKSHEWTPQTITYFSNGSPVGAESLYTCCAMVIREILTSKATARYRVMTTLAECYTPNE